MPRTAFRPETNGFAFVNYWELTEQENAELRALLGAAIDGALGLLGPVGLAARVSGVRGKLNDLAAAAIPKSYGLCGGMAFAALDYFKTGAALPRGAGPDDQPPPGSVLRNYLWRRLRESWVLNGVTFLEWVARLHLLPASWPFDAGTKALLRRSRAQWLALKRRVDDREPVPLGLVGESKDPFMDHQLVAYGYEETGEQTKTIYVYDVNCPGAERTIEVDFSDPNLLRSTESCPRPGNALRGFFCESYDVVVPPAQ